MAFVYKILMIIALAGGGGSSSGGGGGGSFGGSSSYSSSGSGGGGIVGTIAGIIIFGAIGVLFITAFIVGRRQAAEKRRQLTAKLNLAASRDAAWDQQAVLARATEVFHKYQADWQNFDLEAIKAYTTDNYAKHAGLMLYAMQQMGRQNLVSDINIISDSIARAHDDMDDRKDAVMIQFHARARDVLLDQPTGRNLVDRVVTFTEYWHFMRRGDSWVLGAISQSTESAAMLHPKMQQFAESNNMYYSPDWGHLLLPERGQLFGRGFSGTDINNHVIGFWEGNYLVQLYTYSYTPNQNEKNYYLIGQINLPKSYGGILVERTDGTVNKRYRAPKGYRQVSLEWGDFNKRYRVYATDENQVTSFELLNPSFMAWLYDNNLKVNIEVVDNIVYLYSRVEAREDRYSEMMEILRRSHKELRQ